jgi:hypothetical protein
MLSQGSVANISFCEFVNNTASPVLTLNPVTFSGSGGAIFALSARLAVEDCFFKFNIALTGQFDDGANGGAILVENVQQANISRSEFQLNSAEGYTGFSSFASSGSGGAISSKFSVADIKECVFVGNWVSVGGTIMSVGGAIAGILFLCFFILSLHPAHFLQFIILLITL